MPANDPKQIRAALARAGVRCRVPDDDIDKVARQISATELPIRGIDICAFGICFDYVIDHKVWDFLPKLAELRPARLRDLKIFPWGILDPDLFHVRTSHEFEELNAYLPQQA